MVEYQYEDFYDDKFAEDQQAQAEMDVNRLVTRTQEAVNDNISVFADVEDGWDETVPFYVQGGFTMQFEFTYDDAWETKSGRTVVPDYRSSGRLNVSSQKKSKAYWIKQLIFMAMAKMKLNLARTIINLLLTTDRHLISKWRCRCC